MLKNKKKNSFGFKTVIGSLLKSVREFKKPSIITPLFMIGEAVCECLIPFMMSKMLETNELGNVPMNQIWIYGGILIGLALLSLTCGICGGKYGAIASCGFAKNLRKDLFYAVQDFSFRDVDKFSSSSLVTRLTTDVSNVQMAYQMCLRIVIRVPLMFTFSIIMGMTINAKLALIFVCIVPILIFILGTIMFKTMPFFRKIFKKYDALNSSVQENISGIRVVKSYVREDYEKEKFEKASSDVKSNFTKAEKMIALISPAMMLCMYLSSLLITYSGAKIVIGSGNSFVINELGEAVPIYDFAPAQLSAIITYGVQMLSSMMMFSMITVMLSMSIESARRITEVIQTKPDLVSPKDGKTTVDNGEIEFNDVSFKYSEKAEKFALEKVNLTIKSGETVGIIGATGSSKTTLVSLIPRLYDTTLGEVKVGGVNVKDYDLKSLRDSVSVVLQKNILFSGTVRENMQWGNKDASDEEILKANKMAQIDSISLDRRVEQGGANFSGGQKQRLCIARALLKQPKILILDDSTSAVDTKTDALIRKSFREYIPSTTKIIIAQRTASVSDADKIIVLDKGKIAEMGNHDSLMKLGGIYSEIYKAQNKISNESKGGKN
ncbi:MAG: ABC transporter ATP-binding protein/permease [Clostridia bacterium]|nr:ABC transporter ATP-binding protein/permease [Clostridia bacterium]